MPILLFLVFLSATAFAQPFRFRGSSIADDGKELLIDFMGNYAFMIVTPTPEAFDQGERNIYWHCILGIGETNRPVSFSFSKIFAMAFQDTENSFHGKLREILAQLSIPRLDLRKEYAGKASKYLAPTKMAEHYCKPYLNILGHRHFTTWNNVQLAFHQEAGEQEDNIFKRHTFMFSAEQLPTKLFRNYNKDFLHDLFFNCKTWASCHEHCFLSKSSHNILSQFFSFGQVLRYRALHFNFDKSKQLYNIETFGGIIVDTFVLKNHLERTRRLKYKWITPNISINDPLTYIYQFKNWTGIMPSLKGSLFRTNRSGEQYIKRDFLDGPYTDKIFTQGVMTFSSRRDYFGKNDDILNDSFLVLQMRETKRIRRNEAHEALYRQALYYNNYLTPFIIDAEVEDNKKVFQDLDEYLVEDAQLDLLGQDSSRSSYTKQTWEAMQAKVAVYQNQDYLLILHADSTFFLSYLPCDAHPYHPGWDYETYYLSYGRYQKDAKGISLQSWTSKKLSSLSPQEFYELYAQHHAVREMNDAYQYWSKEASKNFKLPSLELVDKKPDQTEQDLFEKIRRVSYSTLSGSPASLSIIEDRKAIFTAQIQHLQDSQYTWVHLVDIFDLKGHLFHEEGYKLSTISSGEDISFYPPHYALRVRTRLREQALVIDKKTGQVRAQELQPWSPPAQRPRRGASDKFWQRDMMIFIEEGIVPPIEKLSKEELDLGDFNPSMAQQIRHYFVPIKQHRLDFDASGNLLGLSFPGGPQGDQPARANWLYAGYLPVFPEMGKEPMLCHRWRRFHEMGRGGYAFFELYKGSLAAEEE